MNLTDAELEAFLAEALPPADMQRIEQTLRDDAALCQRLATLQTRCDGGVHSLAGIWREHRLSCPSRTELGSYLLGVLEQGQADFIRFHTSVSGCRTCLANLEDLQARQQERSSIAAARRQKYFQSSAGGLASQPPSCRDR